MSPGSLTGAFLPSFQHHDHDFPLVPRAAVHHDYGAHRKGRSLADVSYRLSSRWCKLERTPTRRKLRFATSHQECCGECIQCTDMAVHIVGTVMEPRNRA